MRTIAIILKYLRWILSDVIVLALLMMLAQYVHDESCRPAFKIFAFFMAGVIWRDYSRWIVKRRTRIAFR